MATAVDWTLLGSSSGSNTTSVSVTGLTTTAYKQLMILWQNNGCNEGSSDVFCRINSDSGNVYGSTEVVQVSSVLESQGITSATSWDNNGLAEGAPVGTWQTTIIRFSKNGANNYLNGLADKGQGDGSTRKNGLQGILYGGSSSFSSIQFTSTSSRNFNIARLEVWGLA